MALGLSAFISVNNWVDDVARDAYRLQHVGQLVVKYTEANNDWPRNWEMLYKFRDSVYPGDKGIYKTLHNHIWLDFDFDPYSIDTSREWSDVNPLITVITTHKGRRVGATMDPNEFVYTYLKERGQKR